MNITVLSAIEIARCGVMDRMGSAPVLIGRQHEDSDPESNELAGPRGSEKRAVPAVVLDDEESGEQPCRG